jgi:hypothetical protein
MSQMSPLEAGAWEYQEPDWNERFREHFDGLWPPRAAQLLSTPEQVRLVAEDRAFERTLKDWRRWHNVDNKPASAYDGMVALARLRIFPPRSLIRDIERTGACFKEQIDDHMWLTMSQRAWRIIAVEDRMLMLESFGEQTQVDLSRAKWEKYCEKAAEVLETMRK